MLQENKCCFFCGSTQNLERHHIFGGANRNNSEKYGLVVYLCHWCHNEPPMGVHHNINTNILLKKHGQKAFEATHSHEEFMRIFGKNYL